MMCDEQDLGAVSGSRASTEPSSTVSAKGFDPARVSALLPALAKAHTTFERARAKWHAAIASAQASCPHAIWICEDGHSGMLFNHPSIHICAQCRAEVQTATYSGWSTYVWRWPQFMKLAITPQQAGKQTITACRLRDDPRPFQSAEAIAMEARQGTDPAEGLDGNAATARAEGIAHPHPGDSND